MSGRNVDAIATASSPEWTEVVMKPLVFRMRASVSAMFGDVRLIIYDENSLTMIRHDDLDPGPVVTFVLW